MPLRRSSYVVALFTVTFYILRERKILNIFFELIQIVEFSLPFIFKYFCTLLLIYLILFYYIEIYMYQ